jgi:hypothetical protein
MKRTARFCALITALLLSPVHSFGQAAIGMQYFGSFGGGPFDNLNLGNLNNHLDIPIRNKAGRGMPFAYDLTYDSTLWYPTVVNGVKTWEPSVFSGYWGWQNLLYAASGGLTYSTSTSGGSCGQFGQYTWSQTEYSNFVYTDWSGSHPFGYTAYYISSNGPSGQCPPTGPEPATAAPIPAEDKSGITLYAVATSSSVSAYETLPSGYYKFNAGGGATGMDANGNEITFNSGNYTDTLGQTALTVAGGNPPTATTFSYTAPSGAAATYAVSYKSYTVETAFGCSGVAEYNQSGTYLVDRITLPDTSYYQFQYEQTPGAGIGTVTARLSSVTLPTGGSIAYAYGTTNSGNNNGINCSDGTAPVGTSTNPSLVRTLTPGGAWKYVRTNVSGSHWQTTVTSPPDPTIGNDTVIDFQEDGNTNTNDFFETQRLVYQGSSGGSPLNTVITCYNGTSNPTPTSCPTTTAVVSPITRITSFSGLPDTTAVNETDTQYGYISVPGYETEVDSYDYGSSVPGSLLRKVITAYSAFGTTVQPTSVQIQDGSGATKASTIYTYDETTPTPTSGTPQQFSVNGGRGNLTTLASQVSNSVNAVPQIHLLRHRNVEHGKRPRKDQ